MVDVPTLMPRRKRIALIAHDNCKGEMLEWARFNRGTLSEHELYATGTTGRLLGSSPNPLAPPVGEAITDALGPEERERFIGHLARAVERGHAIRRSAVAYLTATKPA